MNMKIVERNGTPHTYKTHAISYLKRFCDPHVARSALKSMYSEKVVQGTPMRKGIHTLYDVHVLTQIALNMRTCEGCRTGECFAPNQNLTPGQ